MSLSPTPMQGKALNQKMRYQNKISVHFVFDFKHHFAMKNFLTKKMIFKLLEFRFKMRKNSKTVERNDTKMVNDAFFCQRAKGVVKVK